MLICCFLEETRGELRVTEHLTVVEVKHDELLMKRCLSCGSPKLEGGRGSCLSGCLCAPTKEGTHCTRCSSALFRLASLFSTVRMVSCSSSVRKLRSIMMVSPCSGCTPLQGGWGTTTGRVRLVAAHRHCAVSVKAAGVHKRHSGLSFCFKALKDR